MRAASSEVSARRALRRMYDQDARAFAVALYLDHGFSYDEISFLFRDSRKFMGDRPSGGGGLSHGPAASTIMEWVHRFLDNGDINPSDANADGSPVFTEAELQALEGMIDADCTMMLDELVYHMYFRTGKYVDISTMCRVLAPSWIHKSKRERANAARPRFCGRPRSPGAGVCRFPAATFRE